MPTDAADRLGSKLDAFTASLDGEEREIFTTMLAFALVGTEAFADEPEVEGFAMGSSRLDSLASLGSAGGFQLSIQQMMDRASYTHATTSTMLKKMSDTQSGIVGNMK